MYWDGPLLICPVEIVGKINGAEQHYAMVLSHLIDYISRGIVHKNNPTEKTDTMKKAFLTVALGAFVLSCGGKKEKKDGFAVSRAKSEEKKPETDEGIPVDLSNKGIGPIKSLVFPEEIDTEMAARGEAKFNAICVACHMVDQRIIGPSMKGVYERRSPEWVMNMMLNPDEMLRKDPIAKALLKEYNNAIMLNQNLTEEEARELAEYLRTL